MFMGSAFQKIFASLTLLYNLVLENGSIKYYLIEEPEALLYPTLVEKFYTIIQNICKENNIKLIVTSNNNYIIYTSKNLLPLTNDEYENINNIPKYLGIFNTFRNILLVEGSDEESKNGFITKLAEIYPILNNFEIIAEKKFPSYEIIKNFINTYNRKIIYLKDAEFLPYNRVDDHNKNCKMDKNNIYQIYTELPCSESYLILNDLLYGDKNVNINKLNKYFNNIDNYIKYNSGFIDAINKSGKVTTSDEYLLWSKITNELTKENIDYKLIVSAIHGHTWVNVYKDNDFDNNKSNKKSVSSKEWFRNTDFKKFHPEVLNILNTTIKYIENILN